MAFKQREIVLVEFPFSSMSQGKTRPALVISNDLYNKAQQDCLLVSLTTRSQPAPYLIPLSAQDIEAGRLLRASNVRYDRVNSIAQSAIQRVVARVKPACLAKIRGKILQLLK